MAPIKWRKWDLKTGNVRMRGTIIMKCGHKLEDTFTGRDEDKAKDAVKRFLEMREKGHLDTCDRLKG